jgi:hypothetical protein
LNSQTNDLDPLEAASTILKAAQDDRVTLRLIGGLAIRFHCHGQHSNHLRTYNDIDLFGLAKERRQIFSVFRKLHYSPNDIYNTMYGRTRLQFIDHKTGRDVDVFLDQFKMDHTLDFRERMKLDPLTIPVTDLLLTKLQIVKLNAKDAKDIVALLEDHQVGYTDSREMLNANRIADVSTRNWGLYTTLNENIGIIMKLVESEEFSPLEKGDLTEKMQTIRGRIETHKKTCAWKLRNLLGERVAWYNEAEVGEGETQ